MKKILYLLFILLSANASAQQVTPTEAEQVAKNFYLENCRLIKKKSLPDVKFSKANYLLKSIENKSYYVFNNENDAGFVVVSGNKAVYPVLAYSLDDKFDETNMPPVVREWMDGYKKQIAALGPFKQSADNKTQQAWAKYTDSEFATKYLTSSKSLKSDVATDVPPLILTTWNQGVYYNALCPTCPTGGSGGHVWAGCVATAQAQIMKYYGYPDHGVGQHSYTHSVYGLQSADFEGTTYNWASMPLSLSSHNLEIATLLYHCGVSVNMDYSPTGSGASSSSARTSLVTYFNYSSNALFTSKGNYTEENWKKLLKSEIDAGRPMYYVGFGSGGHAFNCDGYQGDDYFHFNWGWGGAYNGYFYLNDLTPGGSNFTNSQGALVGAVPEPMETDLDSINAISLVCGSAYNGTTTDGENIVNQYIGSYWQSTGKEKVHKITTTYAGRITAKLSNLNGTDLDVFILRYADRKTMLAAGDSVAIADNCDAGTYYIIVDGRYACEGNYTLTVNCPDNQADLIIGNAKINPNTVVTEGKMNISVNVENIGNSTAPSNKINFYVSEDQSYNTGDIYAGNTTVATLNSHSKVQVSSLLILPASVTTGTKYLVAKVDPDNVVPETDEELNTTSVAFQVPNAGIMDCSSAVALQNGVNYQGNSSLYGEANISNYNWFTGLDNKEVIHSFTPVYNGLVDLEFVESLPGNMNLILLAGCNENACVNAFGLYHSDSDTLRQSFYVAAGVNYYLVVDGNNQIGESEGAYSIKINLPNECPNPVVTSSSTDKCIGDGPAYLYTNWEYNSFQWKKNGVDIDGQNNNSLSVTENGLYSVAVVENGCTGNSEGIQVTYSAKPSSASISALSDTTFCEGSSVVLQLTTGAGYTYQWTKNNLQISQATELDFEATESGTYRAQVTNESCTISSNPVVVTVEHSAYDNGQPIPISTEQLITYWAFTSWGTDESGYGNYAGISGAYQCLDKNDDYSAFSFDGIDDYIFSSKPFAHPDTFTVAVWFKSTTAGPIICFDEQKYVAASTNLDRLIYLDNNGFIRFGVDDGTKHTLVSTKNYADDAWHLAVASLSPSGMSLYLDGILENQSNAVTNGKEFTGYWKVANGDMSNWEQIDNQYYNGKIDDIRIYRRALNTDEIETLYEQQLIKLTAEDEAICASSGGTSIIIENSEPGVNYQLLNYPGNTPMGAAVEGTAGTISLPTGTLSENTQLKIRAENINTSCVNELDTLFNIAVGNSILPEVYITSDATFEHFCMGDTVWFNKSTLYGGAAPVFNWKVNGQDVDYHGDNYSSTLLNDQDVISLEMISSVSCANPNTVSSNEITVNINPLPNVDLGADTSINTNESLVLDAGDGSPYYFWNTGETTQQITVDGSLGVGEYVFSVLVTSTENCSNTDTIRVKVSTALSINNLSENVTLKFYPNPVREFLNIEMNNSAEKEVFIDLLTIGGQVVKSTKLMGNGSLIKDKIPVNDLNQGIYFLRIKTKTGTSMLKIVVE